jgi:hypothetical protein
MAMRTPGRALPAAQPHTLLIITKAVPFSLINCSISPAERLSVKPALVNSARMGAIKFSGYIIKLNL